MRAGKLVVENPVMKKLPDSAPAKVIQGLGPKSSAALAGIGITSLEALRRRDPFEVYAEIRSRYSAVTLNFLYGLIAAVEGVHWQQIRKTQRTMILLRLEEMGIAPR